MADQIPLAEETIEALRSLPRHLIARALLARTPEGPPAHGPLRAMAIDGFDSPVVTAGYVGWLAYVEARRRKPAGMLADRPGYEAQRMLSDRMRRALQSARDPERYRVALCRELNVRPETLQGPDLLDWRQLCSACASSPRMWRQARRAADDIIAVATLLVDQGWLWTITKSAPDGADVEES